MQESDFSSQSYAEAFDRNLEQMRILEVMEGLAYPIEELAGREINLTPDQYGQLHAWDVFLEDVIPRMEQDHAKAHEIKPFEFRQFNHD